MGSATWFIDTYAPRWFVAGELAFDAELVTHVTPTEEFRMTVFDARAGWYDALGGKAPACSRSVLALYATLAYVRRW